MQVLEAIYKKALPSECFHKRRPIRSCWARFRAISTPFCNLPFSKCALYKSAPLFTHKNSENVGGFQFLEIFN